MGKSSPSKTGSWVSDHPLTDPSLALTLTFRGANIEFIGPDGKPTHARPWSPTEMRMWRWMREAWSDLVLYRRALKEQADEIAALKLQKSVLSANLASTQAQVSSLVNRLGNPAPSDRLRAATQEANANIHKFPNMEQQEGNT